MKLKLLLFLFLALGSFFLIAVPSAHAQTTDSSASANTTNNLRTYYNTDPDVPPTLRTYIQSVFIEIASAISCQISGYDPINPNGKCLGVNPNTGRIGFVNDGGGAIGIVSTLIAGTYNIPINTHDYAVDVASNFGITKKAYADNGIGYDSLIPTLALWKAFRNLTYMLFVLMFVVVGLGIMLRIKIDPRTVMTLQNQIPKIIMAIVFVTFSYAIAGFLVDLMYVSIYLAMSIFASAGLNVDTSHVLGSNPFDSIGGIGGISGIASGVASSMSGIAKDIFSGSIGTRIAQVVGGILGVTAGNKFGGFLGTLGGVGGGALGTAIAGPGLGTAVGSGLGKFVGQSLIPGLAGILGGGIGKDTIVSTVASILTYIIIVVALFSALLRLWFTLIKSYIYLLIGVVLGPFVIALGLLPGRAGVGNYVKSLISNLAVFPVTIIMFMLGSAFIQGFTNPPQGTKPLAPPLVGDFSNPQNFGAIIGLAIILMTPEVANMVRETLKAPDFKYANSVGQSIGIAQKGLGNISGSVSHRIMERNRQTGKAEGLGAYIFGGNAFTRTLFNTVNPYVNTRQHTPGTPHPLPNILQRFVNRRQQGQAANQNGGRNNPGNPPGAPGAPNNPPPHGNPPAGGQPNPPGGNNPPIPPAPPAGGAPNRPGGSNNPAGTGGVNTPNTARPENIDSEEDDENTPPADIPHGHSTQENQASNSEGNANNGNSAQREQDSRETREMLRKLREQQDKGTKGLESQIAELEKKLDNKS